MTPIALIAGLVLYIPVALDSGVVKQQPVGAGAGETGGANFLGEFIAESNARAAREAEGIEGRMSAAKLEAELEAESTGESQAGQASPTLVRPESLPQGFIIVVDDQNDEASADRPIFLASNDRGWNASGRAMSPRSDMRWQVILPQMPEGVRLEFKFTLGSWETGELDAEGNETANRTLPMVDAAALDGEVPIFEFEVPDFKDAPEGAGVNLRLDPYRALEVTGDVRRMEVAGGAGGASGIVRDVLVWLPPGYDDAENAERVYPVLYLMDGQNVFEQLPGVPGEWGADETATALIEAGEVEPFVIVATPHAERYRIDEYLPFGEFREVPGDGRAFVAWFCREVKPRAERAFRLETDPSRVAIGGSSLGATSGLYAATARPDQFGMVLAESLPILRLPGAWQTWQATITDWPGRVFIGMGDQEWGEGEQARNAGHVREARRLATRMRSAGVEVQTVIGAGAVHNELAWQERLPGALRFLFPPE